jgi:hypothetical protein
MIKTQLEPIGAIAEKLVPLCGRSKPPLFGWDFSQSMRLYQFPVQLYFER